MHNAFHLQLFQLYIFHLQGRNFSVENIAKVKIKHRNVTDLDDEMSISISLLMIIGYVVEG